MFNQNVYDKAKEAQQALFLQTSAISNTAVRPTQIQKNIHRQGAKPTTMSAVHKGAQLKHHVSSNAQKSIADFKSSGSVNMSSSQVPSSRASVRMSAVASNGAFYEINTPSMGKGLSSSSSISIKGAPISNQFMRVAKNSMDSTFMRKAMLKAQGQTKNIANQVSSQVNFGIKTFGDNTMKMVDNFRDSQFSKPLRMQAARPSYSRTSVVSMALPEGAEGEWGSYDRNYVIGGNWKSNGDFEFANSFPKDVLNKATFDKSKVEVCVAPTDLHLTTVQKNVSDDINVMAQDVSQYGRGAYTGNITADQLTDMKINWTLTGHSERRTLFHESDEDVALKTKIALENGMNVMVCIGELLEEREAGKTGEVNARQLQALVDQLEESQWGNIVIAYEPVWAIGTGKVATPEQAQETHLEIRNWMGKAVSKEVAGAVRILYGGSVNAENATDLITQPDIDGFLVGGASLKPDFQKIIEAADEHKKKDS